MEGIVLLTLPTFIYSSVISAIFNPKLGVGGWALSVLFFVHSIRDNFIRLITCRVARGTDKYVLKEMFA